MSNWVVVYTSSNLNNVEIIKGILAENEIDSVIINKQDSMHLNLINGATELISLHINPENVVKAKHIISKTSF
ncbi:MAG: DUF2007 domain-containing protein [Flavobacteriales bacterium]|nr:DUF2007 domain-containing protein [Flavobacteriales bacterium]NQX97592.1 DUF2007 domain-containing protein [Flavobacteriales bacterium]